MTILENYNHESYHSVSQTLKQEISTLENYHTSVVGSGLESLDYPAGRLIQSGLQSQYPDQFVPGSGLEGLGDLLTKLKAGLKALGDLGKSKGQVVIKKAKLDVAKEIKDTYLNDKWYEGKKVVEQPISVTKLSKLIGDFKDPASLLSAANGAVDHYVNGIIQRVKDMTAYKADALKTLTDLSKMDKPGAAAAKALIEYKAKLDALSAPIPPVKAGITAFVDPVDVAQAKAIATLLISGIEKLYEQEYQVIALAEQWDDSEDTGEDLAEEADDDDAWRFQAKYCNWEDVSTDVAEAVHKTIAAFFEVAKGLEQVITSSIK